MAKRLGNALFIIGAVLTSIGEFVLFGHHTNPEINGYGPLGVGAGLLTIPLFIGWLCQYVVGGGSRQ
jgi:hypothetical protein